MISDDVEAVKHELRSLCGSRSRWCVAPHYTSIPAPIAGRNDSPDGKFIAYRSQLRAGYESDRWRLMVLERATGKLAISPNRWTRWVSGFTWSPDDAPFSRWRIAAASPYNATTSHRRRRAWR
jgi:hypothetical protein